MTSNGKRSAQTYLADFKADPTNAPLALYAGAALHEAGRIDEALAVWTLGDDANPALRSVRHHPQANQEMRALSTLADDEICRHFNTLYQTTLDRAETAAAGDGAMARLRDGVWLYYHQGPPVYRHRLQRPEIYYVPDLPATPIHPADSVQGARAIMAAFDAIAGEYRAALADGAPSEPYVHAGTPGAQWRKLAGAADWSAMYLFYNAQKTENVEKFPETIAALENALLLQKDGGPIEVFFSRLKPGAHIPPHCGLTNTRLTVHLPIVAPDGCSIRVGDAIHEWRERALVAFDDSFEHEAWNKSGEERVVLIFEVHHPDLTAAERAAISNVYDAFDSWVASRTATLGMAGAGA